MLIRCKRDFYKAASLGLCGNTMMTWNSVEDYWPHRKAYPYVGVRRACMTDRRMIPRVHYSVLVAALEAIDATDGSYVISEIPPITNDNARGLQGELSWMSHGTDSAGWVLYYTHKLGYMRKELAESGRHAYGWDVIRLLKGNMLPSEYLELVDVYDHYIDDSTGRYPVIEFSVMPKPMGRYHRCLVIWEIRNDY